MRHNREKVIERTIRERHVTLCVTVDWLRQRHTGLALNWACDLAAKGILSKAIQASFAQR